MSWKMLEKPKTVLVGKSLIQEFVEMEPAPHDRPLSERRLMVYSRILKAGNFRPVTWASVLCKETNCTFRVNGKHTSVLLGSQEKIPEFYVTIERWICDTLNDVATLYGTYDSNLSSRTMRDITMSFAGTIPTLNGINPKLIGLTVSAACALKWDEVELRKVPQAERAEELLERHDFTLWLKGIVKSADSSNLSAPAKHLLRSPVVTAMMATFDRSQRLAKEFWELVRDESHVDRDNASRVLARFLVRASLSNRKNDTTTKSVGPREMYVKCIHGWNAWRKDESTSLAYHAKSPVPALAK